MAYGGPAMAPAALPGGSNTVRQVKLDKECELRVEASPDSPLRLRVLSGTAEIYGTEVPPGIWLSFPSRLKFAVFTWHGATIEMDGTTETDYTADETPMISYVNVHAVLDARRNRAKASPSDSDASQGPRVIVVGPTDSGKSTLSRMLLSWAAKQGWKPTFVDLDIGQGSISIPGCIAATPIELPIDPVEGIPLDMPLVYFHAHASPSGNVDLYKVLVKELAQILERQFAGNVESRASGMVINTMGWVEGVGYELLLHAIDALNASVVLVLGQEKLWSMLRDVLKNKPNVDVVKLQKSGGVVSRNAKVRQKARAYRIREYFYGLSNDLSPHSNMASFSELCIYRVGGGPQAPRSALPVGAEPTADPTRLTPVSVNQDLLHLVLAVSFAEEPDEIISSNVAGFIWITDINFESKKITYLAPSAGALPGKYLIMGSLTWMRVAANDNAEAEKILQFKKAEGEAESKYLSGLGIARQRQAIVDGLRDSVLAFSEYVPGTTAKDVMDMVLVTQYFDTMRASSKSSTVFIPHGPGAVKDVASQIREGLLQAESVAQH